jgi:hypothetical protein
MAAPLQKRQTKCIQHLLRREKKCDVGDLEQDKIQAPETANVQPLTLLGTQSTPPT